MLMIYAGWDMGVAGDIWELNDVHGGNDECSESIQDATDRWDEVGKVEGWGTGATNE